MQNLKFPKKIAFISSVSAADPKVGLWGDTEIGRRMLSIKPLGYSIPGAVFAAGDLNGEVAGDEGTSMPAGITIVKSCTDNGDLSGWFVTLNPDCPCSDCNYEYGITFESHLKEPGVNNAEYKPKFQFFGDKLDSIECTGGVINDTYLLQMEDTIINQITNDSNAWVDARRFYVIDVTNSGGSTTIDVTLADGSTVTVTNATTATTEFAATFNGSASVNTVLFAMNLHPAAGVDRIVITSLDAGYNFTIAAGTDTAIVERKIGFSSKDVNRKVIPQVDSKFGTISKYTFCRLSGFTTAGTTTATIISQGNASVVGVANDNVTVGTYVGSLNSAFGAFATAFVLYATAFGSTVVNIFGTDEIDRLKLEFSASSTTVASVKVSGDGHFPYLTSDDVFRILTFAGHNGELSDLVYKEQPIPGADYCMYDLKFDLSVVPNMHGANHLDMYRQELRIIIPKSMISVAIYDKDTPGTDKCFNKNAETATPDTTFEHLLQMWANCQIANW
jgi:hypothetical protein